MTISLIPFVCMCVNLFKLFEAIYFKGDSRVSKFDKRGVRFIFDAFLPLKDFSCAGLTLLVRYRNYFSTDIFS